MLRGPSIPAQSHTTTLASLHDVYPTLLDIAGIQTPAGVSLAGSSVLPLAEGKTDPSRKSYVVSEYHSVYSGTGMFTIRQGPWKLNLFAPQNATVKAWPPQLFNLDVSSIPPPPLPSLP